ncbi:MAG: hypothetical protein HY782_21270 [Chloroflexi bacterium]|nr:hypothetical protein [Chloroflexota bacterium]
MKDRLGSVHEPDAELLSAEDAIQDAVRLRAFFREHHKGERAVPVRVPLSALLDAMDYLEPDELRQAVQRAEKRLAAMDAGR